MTGSDYTSTGGGALKLKGANVDKKKKKKRKKQQTTDDNPTREDRTEEATKSAQHALDDEDHKDAQAESSTMPELSMELQRDLVEYKGKTEAEQRHEERRRQRLHERLKREGVQTHKERVEQLNRYLSAQSEHHDMPKIGPG